MIREVTHYSLHVDGRHVRNFSTERQARMYAKNTGRKGFTIVPVQRELTDEESAELSRKCEERAALLDMESGGDYWVEMVRKIGLISTLR